MVCDIDFGYWFPFRLHAYNTVCVRMFVHVTAFLLLLRKFWIGILNCNCTNPNIN